MYIVFIILLQCLPPILNIPASAPPPKLHILNVKAQVVSVHNLNLLQSQIYLFFWESHLA